MSRAFEIARSFLDCREVVQRYGTKLDRSGRGSCLLCSGKNRTAFSARREVWKCFRCGEGGDAVRFVHLLFGYRKPLDALKRLDADFRLRLNLSGEPPAPAEIRKRQAEQQAQRDRSEAVNTVILLMHVASNWQWSNLMTEVFGFNPKQCEWLWWALHSASGDATQWKLIQQNANLIESVGDFYAEREAKL